ncbi:hypothetical protein MTR_1g069410 [Medicago truncatula]|uniref:Uncharacterized protein n=1 Tax=Medicago truncatula TaxID=3880 RepID=A0A072VLH2_MEDTR|nr:hypothetical protein MTR_1g069410 [Medicago truncatula]
MTLKMAFGVDGEVCESGVRKRSPEHGGGGGGDRKDTSQGNKRQFHPLKEAIPIACIQYTNKFSTEGTLDTFVNYKATKVDSIMVSYNTSSHV